MNGTRAARTRGGIVAMASIWALCAGCGGDSGAENAAPDWPEAVVWEVLQLSPLPPAPPDPTNAVADDPRAAHLGQFLYFDERMSADASVSCATCHDPELGLGDELPLAVGVGDVPRHSPSLWNVAHNRWFFWDGRADSLWAQALGPLESPVEHGSSRLAIAHLIHGDAGLREAYEAIFGPLPDLDDDARFPPEGRPVADDPDHPHALAWASMTAEDRHAVNVVFSNVGKAIAAYERRLIADDSRFDTFVAGLREGDPDKLAALTPLERRGLELFVTKGNCTACHAGPNLTSGEFHNIGLATRPGMDPDALGRAEGVLLVREDPFNGVGPYSDAPTGEAATKLDHLAYTVELLGQYKVPTLRNVATHPPYMHGGHFDTLHEVLRFYVALDQEPPVGHRDELLVLEPIILDDDEIDAVVAFLESLTASPLDPALTSQPPSPLLD